MILLFFPEAEPETKHNVSDNVEGEKPHDILSSINLSINQVIDIILYRYYRLYP